MAYPDKYTRGYGFASYQESHPQSPLPGSQVDVEFDAAAKSTAAITAFLQKFARSDGRLANGSVGVDQLAPDLTIGFKAPTTWEPSVLYSLGATVFYLSGFYNCTTAHTSGSSFNPDYWDLILDFGSSANAAAASAAAAAASQTAAGASETNAATSETNAAASETNAATSETNAATSETNAAASAAAAAISETNAAASATLATVTGATLFGRGPVASILGTPPGSPANGDRYLIAHSGTTGAWVGKEDQVAERISGAWVYSGAATAGQRLRVGLLLYYFTGAAWAIAGVANVLDYGAKGDGSTDDTAAIQAAFDSGLPVEFPKALTFKKSAPITRTGKTLVYGNHSTILDDGQGFTITDGSNSYIENLNFLPVTTPYTILRDPAVWTAETADVAQSFDGYIPTTQDTDIWGASSFTATITGSAPTQTMTVSGMSIAPGSTLAVGQPVYYPAGNNPANKIGTISALGTGAGGNGTYTITTTTTQSQSGATMSSGLSSAIQAQVYVRPYQRPGLWFRSSSATPNRNVKITNVGGFGSSIVLEGYQISTVKDCDIGGGTGEATIYFYNALSVDTTGSALGFSLARGIGNQARFNTTRYATYCGVGQVGNDNFGDIGNICYFSGESGIKTVPHDGSAELTEAAACSNGIIALNFAFWNYYDGIDAGTVYGTPGYLGGGSVIGLNVCTENRATGATTEGTLSMAVGLNVFARNGTDGLNATGKFAATVGNVCVSNCMAGPTGLDLWDGQQMYDFIAAGDGVASAANVVYAAFVPNTYAYVHEGPAGAGGVPTTDYEGTDVANAVFGAATTMYVDPHIFTDQNTIFSKSNVKAGNGKIYSGATVTLPELNSWVTVVGSTTGKILLRDNTSGGEAEYTFDPIGGDPVAVFSPNITGLEVRSDSGNFQVRVTSGTAPRALGFLATLTQ